MTKRNADRVIWCEPGMFPRTYYGFCPSETAWRQAMKHLGVKDESYPRTDARAVTFENRTTCDVTIIVCIHERFAAKPAVETMALIAHEATHIWQTIRKQMDESDPSPEFEAYAIQDIVLRLGAAYEQSRRPKWARK